MNKKILAILALVSSLAPQVARANDIEPGKEFYTAQFTSAAITIDGKLNEWGTFPILADPKFSIPKGSGAGGTYVLFEEYAGGTWTGPDDQTSAVQVVYDNDNVYFGFTVTDDYHENAANSAWNGDSVQLMVASADRTQQVALYNYALGGTDDAGYSETTVVMHEAGPGGTEAVVTRDAAKKKTYYEIKLPASSIGLTKLEPGTQFGLGMAINDGDQATPGQRGWGGLGAHSIVFGKTPAQTALVTLGANTTTLEILGTGTASLLGGDLTDPENDGLDALGAASDPSWNWKSITSSHESDFEGGENAFNVFDNKVGGGNDKWCCDDPTPGNPVWIAVEFKEPVTLTHFTVTSGNDTPGRDPTDWAIQGSNDGGAGWTDIYHLKADPAPWTDRNQVIKFTLPSPSAPYRMVRYIAYDTPANLHQINELEYFGHYGGAQLAYISGFRATPAGLSFIATDVGSSVIDGSKSSVSIDGQAVTMTTGKVDGVTSFSFASSSPYLPKSVHTYAIHLKDTQGNAIDSEGSFTIAAYGLLLATDRVTPDTSKRGFIWRVHQNNAFQANDNVRPVQQLAGKLGENLADPAAQGVALDVGVADADTKKPITFEIETVINLDQGGGSNGTFTPDDQMPGIPGTTGSTDGIAGEITTYIELSAGMHTLIVNSDDGFRTTTGNINDILIPAAGEFSGGRGAADTQYQVYASVAGVYPFRTVWEEGGGGANIEWKEVLPDKTVVLINDDANGGPKAYRAVTKGLDAPSIVSVTPAINARVGTGTGLEVSIKLGSVAIDNGSVQLSLDDVSVTPAVTSAAGVVTVKGQPALLAVGKHTAKIRYTYGGVERVATWDFTAFPATLDTVHQYPGLVLGSAVYGNGHSGKPGDYAMNMGLKGGPVLVNDASFVNVGAAKDQLTVSFWGKKLENNDSSAFWLNSPSSNNGQRGFQSHLPWSNGHIYFDTAGCCNGDQRIEQVVDGNTVAGYSSTWWQDWHHFAFTKNADVKQIWIDGKLFLEGSGAAALTPDFTSLTIGSIGDLSGLFHGSMDDFAVFSTALSEADINALVAGTKPTALPAADELQAVWEFNDFGDPEGAFVSFTGEYNMVHIVHLQGSRSWDLSKVSLAVDGKPTGAVATRNGSEVTVHFVPSPVYGPKSAHVATLSYPGPTGDIVVKTWEFTVSDYVKDTVHQYIGLVKGTATLTDDKGGHTGAAGDRSLDLGKSGPNYVLNEDASWLNAGAANDTLTVSLWIKKYSNGDSSAFWLDSPSSPAGQRGFQAHIPWSNGNVYFDTAGCCNEGETRNNAHVDAGTLAAYTDTWWADWHHWVFVKNGGVKQVWVDGALFIDGTGTTPLTADFTKLWIGSEHGGSNMRALVDDFAVYGTGLADTDVAKLAAGTRPTALGAAANLLAVWEFNDAPVIVQDPPKFTKITNNGNGTVTVEWTGGGLLQYAGAVTGPWIDATGATSPYTFTPPASVVFGRIKR